MVLLDTHLDLNWVRIFCIRFCGHASRLVDGLANNNKLIYSVSIAVNHSSYHTLCNILWIVLSNYYYYYYCCCWCSWHQYYCYYYCRCSHHYHRARWTKSSRLTYCYINRRPSFSICSGRSNVVRATVCVRAFSCVYHHFRRWRRCRQVRTEK